MMAPVFRHVSRGVVSPGRGLPFMPARLVALDEGPDIPLDRAMVVVGRHPQCDARLDSLRVSRHHCCMTQDHGEVIVRDLGSTNGIRINGQRVELGRLRPGDELSIAHIRYRLDNGQGHEATLADGLASRKWITVGNENGNGSGWWPVLSCRISGWRCPPTDHRWKTGWRQPFASNCRRTYQTIAGFRSSSSCRTRTTRPIPRAIRRRS